MSHKALGIYREPEFSPGKVEADAAILDATMAELKREGVDIQTMDAVSFAAGALPRADLVLPMCQGPRALKRLAAVEQAGAIAINSALSIRNCYRDLLAPGLDRAGVPTPVGALIPTDESLDARKLAGLDLSAACSSSAEICMRSRLKTCSVPQIAPRSKRFSPSSHGAESASRTCSRKSSAAS